MTSNEIIARIQILLAKRIVNQSTPGYLVEIPARLTKNNEPLTYQVTAICQKDGTKSTMGEDILGVGLHWQRLMIQTTAKNKPEKPIRMETPEFELKPIVMASIQAKCKTRHPLTSGSAKSGWMNLTECKELITYLESIGMKWS